MPPERMALLLDWVQGRLDEDESTRLAAQMAADPRLREDVAWVRRLLETADAMPLVEPPPLLRQKLRQQYRRWAEERPVAGAPGLELAAELVFDSRRDRLTRATRGESTEQTTHLVWRTSMAELAVDVRATVAGKVRLSGQVLFGHETSAPVFAAVASGPGFSSTSVEGDVHGRFRLEVPRTVSELRVDNGEITIVAALELES